MFKSKKKYNDKDSLDFQSKSYHMKDNYDIDNLVSANLEYVSRSATPNGPVVETTKQKYIFEIIKENKKTRYREVFTGFIADTENHYFDLPYVVNIKPLDEEFPTITYNATRYGLLLILNDINEPQKMKVNK